jgi:hypothetical protein
LVSTVILWGSWLNTIDQWGIFTGLGEADGMISAWLVSMEFSWRQITCLMKLFLKLLVVEQLFPLLDLHL